MPALHNGKKKSQPITAAFKQGHTERRRSKVDLQNTESNRVVVLMGKFRALTCCRKDHLGVGKTSWNHLKQHHLHSHLCEASLVLWINLI